MASNYYFMECCFEHQKTHIIEKCDLMGCEGKHHFQKYFIEKKDDQKKLAHFYCLDRKQLGEYWRCAQIKMILPDMICTWRKLKLYFHIRALV